MNALKAANLYDWIISRIHLRFTEMADELYGNGQLTQDERKALSGGIGKALDAWNIFAETNLLSLKERRPYEEAPSTMTTKGNALKAVSKTDDQLIVENHIILFGGRDLEGKVNNHTNPDGTKGEFFTKSSDLRSAYTNTGVLYVDWEHGFAGVPELKGAYDPNEPKYDDILGHVDWSTAKATDEGVLVRRILDRRSRFIQMIEPLIDEGLIGTSSAARGDIEIAANGEILKYPLARDTLTVMPMDPRMLSANALVAVKSLAATWPAMKAAIVEDEPNTNQPAPVADENTEQPKLDDVAQDDAPAAKPEKAPEPDNTELATLLQQFVTTISTLLKG